jgi:8-oxo-dGTP pyrophosphatase MutT (NUDIX family)
MNTKKLFCINCTKNTHLVKDCNEPIYSYGIICAKLDESLKIPPYFFEKILVNKIIDTEEFNFANLENLKKLDLYKDKIKFLLIQRKHSFSYVEFIRGKYNENNIEEIIKLLNLMTFDEINKILNNEFELLWNDLWKKTSHHKSYQKEYEISNNKFLFLKKKYNIIELINKSELFSTPEWGFPKGRKDKNEKNIECAMREFSEETGITSNKYCILNRVNTIEETVICNKNKTYKLVYYIGITNENIDLKINNDFQKCEIGDLEWLNFDEVITKIRPYHIEKIKIVYQVYFLFINLIEIILQNKKIELNSI